MKKNPCFSSFPSYQSCPSSTHPPIPKDAGGQTPHGVVTPAKRQDLETGTSNTSALLHFPTGSMEVPWVTPAHTTCLCRKG